MTTPPSTRSTHSLSVTTSPTYPAALRLDVRISSAPGNALSESATGLFARAAGRPAMIQGAGFDTITVGAFSTLNLDAGGAAWDPDGLVVAGNTERCRPTAPGWYFFSGFQDQTEAGGAVRALRIRLNGATVIGYREAHENTFTAIGGQLAVSAFYYMNGTTDYVELNSFTDASPSGLCFFTFAAARIA